MASKSTIGMVLVQEDNMHNVYAMYYLRKGTINPQLHYSNIEKLALEIVIIFQRLQNYMLLRNTTIIMEYNPMKHIHIFHINVGGNSQSGLLFFKSLNCNLWLLNTRNP